MSKRITEKEVFEYLKLESLAKKITKAINNFDCEVLSSNVPESVKQKCLDITNCLDLFGLAYRLHPQSEWIGGDSNNPKNFVTREPHIAKE